MGVGIVIATTILVLTNTLPGSRALAGFAYPTTWLIFSAFLFARAVTLTGLGPRVAYLLVSRIGHNSLLLGYAVAATNLVLAPFIPSDTARGGGIVYPVARGLAATLAAARDQAGAARLGAFVILAGFHSTYVTSGMFLTSMAANPIMADLARSIAGVELTWARWALASIVPGFLTLALGTYLLFRLTAGHVTPTGAAVDFACSELARMGNLSVREGRLALILLAVAAGWVTSPWHQIHNAFVALAGICAMVLCAVVSWEDLLDDRNSLDALLWFGPVLMMTDELVRAGVVDLFSRNLFAAMPALPPMATGALLTTLFLYAHYGFASMTAHATALYPGFLAAGIAAGCPPVTISLWLAFAANLDAGLTHYGTGSAPVFFSAGFVSQSEWWKLGFLLSLMNLVIWLLIAPVWWRFIGL